jgi:hypothetical protein
LRRVVAPSLAPPRRTSLPQGKGSIFAITHPRASQTASARAAARSAPTQSLAPATNKLSRELVARTITLRFAPRPAYTTSTLVAASSLSITLQT